MTQVEFLQPEGALTVLKSIITDHVGLRLVDITVEEDKGLEVSEFRGLRVNQMKETENSDRVATEVQGLELASTFIS